LCDRRDIAAQAMIWDFSAALPLLFAPAFFWPQLLLAKINMPVQIKGL